MAKLPLKPGDIVFVRTAAGFFYRGPIVSIDEGFLVILDRKDGTHHALAWPYIAEIQIIEKQRDVA